MGDLSQGDRDSFFLPRTRYRGEFKPENLLFNANLQEFAQKVGYISALETSGKLSPYEAYKKIQALWKDLKHSKKELGISGVPPEKS